MKLIKEIYEYREMIFSLVRRELRGRYKGSVLGFLWTFLNPLLQLAVYSIVFSTIIKVMDIDKYYIFLFVAFIPWVFFSTSVTGGSISIVANKNMVTKIFFPREIIPISYVTSCFVNMLLCFIVIFAVLLFSGVGFYPPALIFLPFVMIAEYVLALGFTLIASAITVYFRDLEHILGIIMMAWMYFTPIMYSESMIPEQYLTLFNLNPMYHVIRAYRYILFYKALPDLSTVFWSGVCGLVFMLIGFILFDILKKRFAETL